MNTPAFPLLESVDTPEQLRALPENQLSAFAWELRNFLLHSVSRTGGHLASNLGIVELSIALHYVFNTPKDRLVWDVGHQSYPHKILTGRRKAMAGIRQDGGISGFPRRDESPYDAFGAGHSSTSIGAALGMALAARQTGARYKSVAIIGDGAMSAGMAFEALNHAGGLNVDLLVILNDNDMSISPNVGGLSAHFTRILSSQFYTNVRKGSKKVLSHMPGVRELAKRTEEHMKGMVTPGTMFEELGFNYIGPVDGHDVENLVNTLKKVRDLEGLQLLHVVTQKGKGFAPAEADPCVYHGVGAFDRDTGEIHAKGADKPTYTHIFSEWLCDMAAEDARLIGITPAMREGSGLVKFSEHYPDRYFDVGIAEQHSVVLAAGMACEGLKPVVAIYSTFLQRAYDQLIHDVALQNLPVLFALDRAGLVGPDGPTHAGSFDLSYLRCVPNMVVMAPANENECRQMLNTGFKHNGPSVVRYPRGTGPGVAVSRDLAVLPIGKAEIRRQGANAALLAFGSMLAPALEAAEEINATVVNMRFVKPLDEILIIKMAEQHKLLVTIEENAVQGGAGSAINECLSAHEICIPVVNLGLPDHFLEHGSSASLLASCGLNKTGIVQSVARHFEQAESRSGGQTR
ncbi:MAG: 1-deoxy-D-xylulose-5-phosphate synthase [Gammaproteobacteria bacterium]|nr:1-deoxy-D-xylulose-5-phosphate synthase [Gammaproteobacteria bacterium]